MTETDSCQNQGFTTLYKLHILCTGYPVALAMPDNSSKQTKFLEADTRSSEGTYKHHDFNANFYHSEVINFLASLLLPLFFALKYMLCPEATS